MADRIPITAATLYGRLHSLSARAGRAVYRMWRTLARGSFFGLGGTLVAIATFDTTHPTGKIGLSVAAILAFAVSETRASSRASEDERHRCEEKLATILSMVLPPGDSDCRITITHNYKPTASNDTTG